MISDCLSDSWLPRFTSTLQRAPILIAGSIRNQTSEHINVNTFVDEFQRALINSKRVIFAASIKERDNTMTDRIYNLGNSTEAQNKKAKEISPDFILSGTISSIVDEDENKKVIYYQVNFKLLDITSKQIVWNGEKKIKKLIGILKIFAEKTQTRT